ncbi:hypothetical protein BDZ45DRAFT_737749 [Acephala macrosclerotiorum]|nr:hypothetical protein BDZ45DRAFT_737749 [Acephala macrosclerotiorum]
MSTYPNSTCATDGSSKDFPPLPVVQSLTGVTSNTTTHSSPRVYATTQALQVQCINTYLNSPVDSQPHFQHTKSGTSMPAKAKDMKAYLDKFDDIMKKNQN